MKIKTWQLKFLSFIILGFILYFPILLNGFVADDEGLIVQNNLLHSINNWPQFLGGGNFYSGGAEKLGGVYYKPVFSIVLSTIYTFFGQNPAAFHFFSILFHAVNAGLVYLLLGNFWLGLLFLVHPVNVESVAYVSGMQEPLFLLFGLLALKNSKRYLSWLLLLLSLLTKETGVLFLPMFFLIKKDILGPVLVAVIYTFLRFGVGQVYFNHEAISPIMRADLATRLINIPSILFFYIKQIIFPIDLLFSQNWLVHKINFVFLFLDILFFAGLFKFKLSKLFLFWFMIGIFLHLQIFPLDTTVSDRWLYFPLIGLIAQLKNVNKKILILVIFIYAIRTFFRTFEWRDNFTLLSHDAVKNSDSFALESALGNEYLKKDDPENALIHLQKSINLFPSYLNWTNLGVAYGKKQNYDLAIESYKKALTYGDFYLANENLAGTYLILNENEKVRDFCLQNLNKFPNSYKLRIYLAVAFYRLGDKSEALNQAKISYKIAPLAETEYLINIILKNEDVVLKN